MKKSQKINMHKQIDYRVVVGIDFGTTYSGFAYAHKKNQQDIYAHTEWQDFTGKFKTPTVLSYDDKYETVQAWGFPALAKKPKSNNRKRSVAEKKPVELFKLHLGKVQNKPPLPKGFDYRKAITDYLKKLGEILKETVNNHWKVDFDTQVSIVLTIPAEFDDSAITIMRECAFKAGLIPERFSRNLKFTTEPEAAAIYCMKYLKEHNLLVGSSFMIVDCGGGTVDLTTRQLLEGETLSETTVRTGDYCGGSFVDQEFLRFMERKVGSSAIKLLKENHYGQLQYMVQEFCRMVKVKFTGVREEFQPVEFELDEVCPVLEECCRGTSYFDEMEVAEWTIKLTYEDVKAMFDPVVNKITRLIEGQLRSCDEIHTLFMVGGFSESKYLQTRIKQEFSSRVSFVSIPPQPSAAILKGAVLFGSREEVVTSRVLKWTYGTDIARKWRPGDPKDKNVDGNILLFERLIKRGTQIGVNEKVKSAFTACNSAQEKISFDMYVTPHDDAKYCDDEDVKQLGKWSIDLPSTSSSNEEQRSIMITMIFGSVEIEVIAQNAGTGEECKTTFDLDI